MDTDATARGAVSRRSRLLAVDVEHLFRRYGLYIATMAALVGLKWRGGYDLEAFLAAAKVVALGGDPYAATYAAGVSEWGTTQVYVSPPFVAWALSPFANLPSDVVFAGLSIAGLLAVLGAVYLIDRDRLPRRAPSMVFGLTYVWASLFLGQVNLFVLAGLLLALGCRRNAAAGLGLALAVALRASPAAFGLVLALERRWRALGWAALAMAVVIALQPERWLEFVDIARSAGTLPTLDVPVQTSVAAMPVVWWLVAVGVVVIVGASVLSKANRPLLAGTAIGLALVLLPTNAWHHWFAFALAPLVLDGDRTTWSRWALLSFVAVSFLPMGWPSVAVSLVVLLAMLSTSVRGVIAARRVSGPDPAGILGAP
ncbi:MAG TPA: glycosyltransferase family 87 protein [Coriobacteriia bacterium]|jgi:alpha-1,2-mannosyltransferase